MNLAEIAALLGLNLALVLAVMAGLWGLALRSKRLDFIDGVWPLLMAGLAAVTFLLTEGDPVRKGLLLWLVAIWAAPQAWRRLSSAARHEADARYAGVAAAMAARHGWKPSRLWLLLFLRTRRCLRRPGICHHIPPSLHLLDRVPALLEQLHDALVADEVPRPDHDEVRLLPFQERVDLFRHRRVALVEEVRDRLRVAVEAQGELGEIVRAD